MNYCRIPLRVPRELEELLPEDCKLRYAIVDECFEDFIGPKTWCLGGYLSPRAYGTNAKGLHQLVLPAPDGYEVDHVGRNSLDNRWRSLRWATREQNIANKRGKEGAASAYKGVGRPRDGWIASIKLPHAPKHMTNGNGKITRHNPSEIYCALWYELIARQSYGGWHTGSFDNVSDAALLGIAIDEGVEVVDAINPGEKSRKGGCTGKSRIFNTLSPEHWMQRVTEKRRADRAEMAERQQAAFNYAKIHGLPGHPVREGEVTLEELQGDMQ